MDTLFGHVLYVVRLYMVESNMIESADPKARALNEQPSSLAPQARERMPLRELLLYLSKRGVSCTTTRTCEKELDIDSGFAIS